MDISNESKATKFNVVWFKRDLRLRDHKPLKHAISSGKPLFLTFIVEPSALEDKHLSTRHWRFIHQSIENMNKQLSERNLPARIIYLFGSASDVFCSLKLLGLHAIYSYQEIGLDSTFQRDRQVNSWCKNHNVQWHEYQYGAVCRPLTHRRHWKNQWNSAMAQAVDDVDLDKLVYFSPTLPNELKWKIPKEWLEPEPCFQKGGEQMAWYTFKDFFKERGQRYFGNIGNPSIARKACSRLSPYLAWGNLSIKQVVQYTDQQKLPRSWSRSIRAFQSRLAWRCHFIQKFESECEMEFRPVNKAYVSYPYREDIDLNSHLDAWKQGKTGIPIIDASMRALIQTGYLNFRMRAMVVSFLCHHLNIDWRLGVVYLGSLFLDFEPGIHYPQFHMQAGITGTNTIRIYNPVKQSIEKDPDGVFIRKWLPELAMLPNEYIHQPWRIPPMEALFLEFNLGKDYPLPIINIENAARDARERLWAYRDKASVKHEARRILMRHTVPD